MDYDIDPKAAARYIKDKFRYSKDFGAFMTEVLNLKYEPFHKEWFDLIEDNSFNLLLAPRTHGKSFLVGAYITWKIVNDPNIRILIITINQDMALGMMRFVKGHLEENDKIINIFGPQKGNMLWSNESILVNGSQNRKEATLNVIGITGGMVGKHPDIIVLDDITDKDSSKTEHRRNNLQFQLDNEILPMLESYNPISKKKYGKIIVIGTRWSQLDIYDYISKKAGYNFKKYQALMYEPDELKDFVGKFTKEDWDKSIDDVKEQIRQFIRNLPEDKKPKVLWPGKVPYEELARIRSANGNISFMMQYQNEFVSPEDAPIKWEWIETAINNYKSEIEKDFLKGEYVTYLGVDLASKGEEGDFFTITCIGVKDGFVYVLDGIRTKLTQYGKEEEIKRMYIRWNPAKIGVEQAGPQKIVVQDLQTKMVGYPIIPVKTSTANDRPTRVMQLSVLFETNCIFLNPKLVEWIDELVTFPRGGHDDCIDSLSFAVQSFRAIDDDKSVNWSNYESGMISARKTVKPVENKYWFTKI